MISNIQAQTTVTKEIKETKECSICSNSFIDCSTLHEKMNDISIRINDIQSSALGQGTLKETMALIRSMPLGLILLLYIAIDITFCF